MEEKWSACFDTFLRYKFISTEYPLYGITHDVGQLAAALNSALPTQENRVELGCTWTPTDCLMVNATLYVENAMSDAPYVAWTSNSLPFTVSAWWAPTQDWSFSAGAAEMDSWINQNVSLSNLGATPGATVPVPWQYTGVADVFNLGTRYQATEKLSFTGEFEYVHGMNSSSAVVNPNEPSRHHRVWTLCRAHTATLQHRPVLAGQDAVVPPGRGGRLPPAAARHVVRPLQLLRLPGRLRHDQRPGQHDPGRNERKF